MNTKTVAVVAFLLSALQLGIYQWTEVQSLRREIRLLQQAKDILEDQAGDLALTVARLTSESESMATRQFVLGAMAAGKNPDYYSGVWHDGYNRGMQAVEQQRQYTTGEGLPAADPPR